MANVKQSERLTDREAKLVRQMLKSGRSQAYCAGRLGVSQATISRVARRAGAFAKAA